MNWKSFFDRISWFVTLINDFTIKSFDKIYENELQFSGQSCTKGWMGNLKFKSWKLSTKRHFVVYAYSEAIKKYHPDLWFISISLGYLLTPNPETRPDIYQASYLTFKLKNPSEKCPVQNLNVSTNHNMFIISVFSMVFLVIRSAVLPEKPKQASFISQFDKNFNLIYWIICSLISLFI